jgi:hypothetical protein
MLLKDWGKAAYQLPLSDPLKVKALCIVYDHVIKGNYLARFLISCLPFAYEHLNVVHKMVAPNSFKLVLFSTSGKAQPHGQPLCS